MRSKLSCVICGASVCLPASAHFSLSLDRVLSCRNTQERLEWLEDILSYIEHFDHKLRQRPEYNPLRSLLVDDGYLEFVVKLLMDGDQKVSATALKLVEKMYSEKDLFKMELIELLGSLKVWEFLLVNNVQGLNAMLSLVHDNCLLREHIAFILMDELKTQFLEKRSSLHHLAEILRKLVHDRSRNAILVDLRFLEGMFDVVVTGSEDIGVRQLLIYIIAYMARWYELSWKFDRVKGKERFEAILKDPCEYMQKMAQVGLNFLNDPAVREGEIQQRINENRLQKLRFM